MKETVERILDEEYDFGKEVKPLSFSCDVIRCEMQAGREQYGAFYILGDSGAQGRIYVSDLRFETDADSFEGSSTEIPYKVSSYGLKPGDKRAGFISIISNRGEYELPFEITVQSEMPMSSMGEIRNLFHFANLAKEEWNEAVSLFYSHSFVNILEDSDAQFMTAYRALSAYSGSEQNMEQFLQVADYLDSMALLRRCRYQLAAEKRSAGPLLSPDHSDERKRSSSPYHRRETRAR